MVFRLPNGEIIKDVHLCEIIETFQGEGPDSGKKCLLLRFKHCNKNCKWCDTKNKLSELPEKKYEISEINEIIKNRKLMVLITGGEPTFSLNFLETLTLLNELDTYLFNVETNGNNIINLINNTKNIKKIKFIFSPKIFDDNELKNNLSIIKELKDNKKVFIKYVIYEENKYNDYFLNELYKLNINDRV